MKITSLKYRFSSQHADTMVFECNNNKGLRIQCTNYESALLGIQSFDSNSNLSTVAGEWNDLSKTAKPQTPQQTPAGATLGRIGYELPKEKTTTLNAKDSAMLAQGSHDDLKGTVWQGSVFAEAQKSEIHNSLLSTSDSFDGQMLLTVSYAINEKNELLITHAARTSKKNLLSLTNSLAWNLSNGAEVLGHKAVVYADSASVYPERTSQEPVDVYDLNYKRQRVLNSKINHYFLLKSEVAERCHPLVNIPDNLHPALWLSDPKSGRYIELFTNYPMLYLKIVAQHTTETSLLVQPCIPYDSPEIVVSKKEHYAYYSYYRFGTL